MNPLHIFPTLLDFCTMDMYAFLGMGIITMTFGFCIGLALVILNMNPVIIYEDPVARETEVSTYSSSGLQKAIQRVRKKLR